MSGIKGFLLLFMLLGAMYLGAQALEDLRGECRIGLVHGDTGLTSNLNFKHGLDTIDVLSLPPVWHTLCRLLLC